MMFSTLVRWLVGGTFLYSGLGKIRFPRIFAEALSAYQVIPESLLTLVALWLPWLELLLGLMLLTGYKTKGSALLTAGLSLGFVVILTSALWRGLDIPCGCFVGVEWAAISWRHILFNITLMVSAIFLYRRGPGRFSLDPEKSCENSKIFSEGSSSSLESP